MVRLFFSIRYRIKNRGLTILELITVITIISILILFQVPDFFKWAGTYKLKGTVNVMESTMQLARIRAIRENSNVVISFDPDNDSMILNQYIVFVDNGSGNHFHNSKRDRDETIVKTVIIPSGVNMYEAAFGSRRYTRFNQQGLGLAGHVYLKNKRNNYMGIKVSVTGSIRIVKSPDGGITWESIYKK